MLTKSDFKQIRQIVKDEVNSEVCSQIKPLKKDIEKIRKDVGSIVNFFDNEYLELRQRVERIENHLNLSSIVQ